MLQGCRRNLIFNTSFLNQGITAVFEIILKKATVTIVFVTMVTVEKLFFPREAQGQHRFSFIDPKETEV